MSSNQLKIIACITMLADHAGILLFPDLWVLRVIGRLSMPIFAFLIAEGCLHTRSRLKYFLSLFILATLCQAVFTVQSLLWGGVRFIYLNILFTFSVSIALCFIYTEVSRRFEYSRFSLFLKLILLGLEVAFTAIIFSILYGAFPLKVEFDYGFAGAVLPLFAIVLRDKIPRLLLFTVGLFLMNFFVSAINPLTWFSLLSVPLLFLYNGTRGGRKLKYLFYLFYPLHIAALYGIALAVDYLTL